MHIIRGLSRGLRRPIVAVPLTVIVLTGVYLRFAPSAPATTQQPILFDHEAMVHALMQVSQLVTDFPEIVELDINPLMVFEEGRGAMALDMRLILKEKS